MTIMTTTSKIAYVITIVSFLWIIVFICIGSTSFGKAWYGSLAIRFFDDAKAGVIVMNLIIPVLFSGTAASLFTTKSSYNGTSSISWHRRWNAGESDFNSIFTLFILIPGTLLLLTTIHRNFYGRQLTLDDQIMDISNAFASVAMCSLAVFLIPVAKQSPILSLLQWTPAAAIRLHINTGRLLILASILHGAGHVYRWTNVAGEGFWSMILPPAPCWSLTSGDYTPECNDYNTDCTCYDHFRNLTGVAAVILMVVIAITSTNYVRRHYYRIFYMIHVLVAPSCLLLVIFHWNKSILYLAPSLLYYAATSAPVVIERSRSKTQIHSMQRIHDRGGRDARPCVALTINATERAVLSYASGQYVKVSAPMISHISHPFTINKVPGKPKQLRIIFRVTGNFTHQLAEQIQHQRMPLYIEGYFGTQLRLTQILQHDIVVIVAGGIGITSYLGVLGDLRHGDMTKEVILHWICREAELVDYVKREYFDLLLDRQNDVGIKIRLIVHKTGSSSGLSGCTYHERPTDDLEGNFLDEEVSQVLTGVPFEPSKFSVGMNSSFLINLPIFFTFGTISWVGLYGITYLYNANNAAKAILYRGWAALFIAAISIVVAALGNCATRYFDLELLDSARVYLGFVWSRVNAADTTNSVEFTNSCRNETPTELSFTASTTYDERTGRASMHELLKGLDDARYPGLFLCGPSGLMKDLRHEAEEKCRIRIRQCLSETKIAIYQEMFEL